MLAATTSCRHRLLAGGQHVVVDDDRRAEPVRRVQGAPPPVRRRLRAGSLLPSYRTDQVHYRAPRVRRQQHHQAPPGIYIVRPHVRARISIDRSSWHIADRPTCGNVQELPESARADAVSSMVYEAEARLRDPVYGCAGAVCRLQKEANELKVQLARAQADLLNARAQHDNLVALVCVELAHRRRDDDQQLEYQAPAPPLPHPAEYCSGGAGCGATVYQPLYDSDLDSAAWGEPQLWT